MEKNCTVCGKKFEIKQSRQNICSWDCKQVAARERARRIMRIKRNKDKTRRYPPCEVCGYPLFTELHHEDFKKYNLCKSCHSLITRAIFTLNELFEESKKWTLDWGT